MENGLTDDSNNDVTISTVINKDQPK